MVFFFFCGWLALQSIVAHADDHYRNAHQHCLFAMVDVPPIVRFLPSCDACRCRADLTHSVRCRRMLGAHVEFVDTIVGMNVVDKVLNMDTPNVRWTQMLLLLLFCIPVVIVQADNWSPEYKTVIVDLLALLAQTFQGARSVAVHAMRVLKGCDATEVFDWCLATVARVCVGWTHCCHVISICLYLFIQRTQEH